MQRREFLAGAATIALASRAGGALADDPPFSRSVVLDLARGLAAKPFAPPTPAVPEPFASLSATDYAAIQFRPEKRFFVDPPTGFAVELLHTGFIYTVPVEISIVSGGVAQQIAYSPDLYNFGPVPPPADPAALRFAGFRALRALNQPDQLEPFTVFAGASYFRAVSKNQVFGLSARGLAIGTGEAEGEEFPFFRAHWIEAPGEDRMVVHSLLDGPSAAGAYRFTMRPGDPTTFDVEATIFARADIAHIGLAPLTSMFLYDARTTASTTTIASGCMIRTGSRSGTARTSGCGGRCIRRGSCR